VVHALHPRRRPQNKVVHALHPRRRPKTKWCTHRTRFAIPEVAVVDVDRWLQARRADAEIYCAAVARCAVLPEPGPVDRQIHFSHVKEPDPSLEGWTNLWHAPDCAGLFHASVGGVEADLRGRLFTFRYVRDSPLRRSPGGVHAEVLTVGHEQQAAVDAGVAAGKGVDDGEAASCCNKWRDLRSGRRLWCSGGGQVCRRAHERSFQPQSSQTPRLARAGHSRLA
jgi:hypothetical protein